MRCVSLHSVSQTPNQPQCDGYVMAYCCQSAPLWTRLSEPYRCWSASWASPSFREGSYEDAVYSKPLHKNFNCDGYHANCQKPIQDWLCLQKSANPLQYQQHKDQHSYQSASCEKMLLSSVHMNTLSVSCGLVVADIVFIGHIGLPTLALRF